MSKLSNELYMLKLLSTGRKYSLKELSETIEVSKRMIRTYKEDMEKAGIFVETIKGPYGGYVLRNPAYLASPVFTQDDCDLLENIKNKDENLKHLLLKMKCIAVNKQANLDLNENNKIYNIISRAIKEKRKVRILYYTEGKGKKTRVIHPLQIMCYGNTLACAAYCEYKKDLRHFVFDRMEEIELLADFY